VASLPMNKGVSLRFMIGSAAVAVFMWVPAALGVEISPQRSANVPCAVLKTFSGMVQILDSSRTHVLDGVRKTEVPCGGFVSVERGWVEFKHRDGFRIHVGKGSFVEFPDSNGQGQSDHVLVFRGQIFGRAENGDGEFRVATANGRARVTKGAIMLIFNGAEEETQLVGLEGVATLENRFETTRKMRVKAGEATSLNFLLQRVFPSNPRAVAAASLNPRLADLHIDSREAVSTIHLADKRRDRALASDLVGEHAGLRDDSESVKRGVAAMNSNYVRHREDEHDEMLRSHWAKKMMSGEDTGEQVLFPDKFYGRPQKVKVEVGQPGSHRQVPAYRKSEELEKRRLIEELSQIREE
jgi:hypothetical protein